VLDANQGEPPTFVVPTTAMNQKDLPESVQEAIAAGCAKYERRGNQATISWYGTMDYENKICLGDLQKSAMRILQVDLESQDMTKMMAALGEDYTAGSYSANNGAAALVVDYIPMTAKGEVENVDAIHASYITADPATSTDVKVPVFFNGETELTSVRLAINCDLPIATDEAYSNDGGCVIDTENDFEFNPETNEIVIYKGDGEPIDTNLFEITYSIADAEEGVYPVTLRLIEATGTDGELVDILTVDGKVEVPSPVRQGDVNGDGSIDNLDLVMIARYLVQLTELTDEQLERADVNLDGKVNNTDLVLISRMIVGLVK